MKTRSLCAALATCSILMTTLSEATWSGTQIALPELYSTLPHFGALAFDQYADGRLVYGNNARLYMQDAFGSDTFTQITNGPDVDPSFISVVNNQGEHAVLGAGGYANTSLFFSEADYTGGACLPFTESTYRLQNYAAAYFDGRLYVAGANDGGNHSVSAIDLSSDQVMLLIQNISTYSAGIAVDREGNLFVASADDNKVYRFSKSQLDAAVSANTPLTLSDGTFIVQFRVSTTIAVDEYGRLWAAGWQTTGIEVYNPRLEQLFTYIPTRTNTNYRVDTFTQNGVPYMAYLNQSGWTTGSSVEYGYDFAAKFARDSNRDFHHGLTSACDVVVYDFASGAWLIRHPDQAVETKYWGWNQAFPVPADYDGDGITDIAVYAPADGAWLIQRSSDSSMTSMNWGWNAVIPVQADYDGDGITDIAVYYPPDGAWMIFSSLNNTGIFDHFGWAEVWPVPADYDGDGRTDRAVYYPDNGAWIIRSSATGEMIVFSWGWAEAYPVPADYDGDGITDIAVYAPADGAWLIRNSSDPAHPTILNWGWNEVVPVPADYDADGLTDIGVYHASSGTWLIRESSDPSGPHSISWGWNAAFPGSSVAGLNLLY